MAFDVEQLSNFALKAIIDFAKAHKEETFYAFAIDASLLCFNSEQAFERTLNDYQKRNPEYYSTAEDIAHVKENTGDWEYQGFSDFTECEGFDSELYDDHYNLGLDLDEGDAQMKVTEYALAMDQVLERLKVMNVFKPVNRTKDFKALRVEHSY
jgi:Domain of unknown function (DUF4303)